MRRLLPVLLSALAACSSPSRAEPRFERPIRIEARGDGAIEVDGAPASWDTLGEALRAAIRSRPGREGFRPSAVVRIGTDCPENTSARLLEVLVRAGVKEILFGDVRG